GELALQRITTKYWVSIHYVLAIRISVLGIRVSTLPASVLPGVISTLPIIETTTTIRLPTTFLLPGAVTRCQWAELPGFGARTARVSILRYAAITPSLRGTRRSLE